MNDKNVKENITIIVTLLNNEDSMERCLNSILNQTYRDIEIIIVDDGSYDLTHKICEDYAKRYDNIELIYQQNSGKASAYNRALEFVNSKYVMYVDGKDFLSEDAVSYLLNLIKDNDCDLAISNYQNSYIHNEIIDNQEEENIKIISGNDKYNLLWDENILSVIPYAKLYKTDILKKIKYPYGLYHEDEYVAHEILSFANKIVLSNRKIYCRDNSNQNDINNSMEYKYHACIALKNRIDFFKKNDLNEYAERTINDLKNYIDLIIDLKDYLIDDAYYLNEIRYIAKSL